MILTRPKDVLDVSLEIKAAHVLVYKIVNILSDS